MGTSELPRERTMSAKSGVASFKNVAVTVSEAPEAQKGKTRSRTCSRSLCVLLLALVLTNLHHHFG